LVGDFTRRSPIVPQWVLVGLSLFSGLPPVDYDESYYEVYQDE